MEQKAPEKLNRFANFAKKTTGSDITVTNSAYYEDTSFGSRSRTSKIPSYTKEEAEDIIETGDAEQLRELSQSYFYSSGFYRRLLLYYTTILYYTPLLIPHMVGNKKQITEKKYENKYFDALELINSLNFEQLCRHFAQITLVEGAYYGLLKEVDGKYAVQDLPYEYCRSRLRSFTGVDIVEFDVTWFDSIMDDNIRKESLDAFPKEIRRAYRKYHANRNATSWVRIPAEKGIHFTFYEDRPFFSCVIPSIIHFGDYIELEKEKDEQLLHSLIVQEMPHIASTGDFVIEPEEAVEFHEALKKITTKNKHLDGITTYGKVSVEKTVDDNANVKNNLEKISSILYQESGTSRQIFAAEGNTSLERSIQNDIALMMSLANSFSIWLKNFVNSIYADKNITFGVEILPVGQYNVKDYQSQALNAAQYGYSFMIPSLAMGLEQNQLIDLKTVEIDVLKMEEKLVPLRSSHTESGNQSKTSGDAEKSASLTEEEQKQAEKEGASKPEEERSDKTLQNRESSVGGEN